MRNNFYIRLAILISIAISIIACDDLGPGYKKLWARAVDSSSTTLTADTWADVNISSGGEQWFDFTATADTQYIHTSSDSSSSLNIQVYNSNSNGVGELISVNNWMGNTHSFLTITSGQVYYIKVTNNNFGSGTYRIAFNETFVPPGVTQLASDTWADGSISQYSEQWFKFTTTADTQYIHINFNTLNSYLTIYIFDSYGNTVETLTNIGNSHSPLTMSNGQVYYIRVTNNEYNYENVSGTYRIAFNETFVPPDVISLIAETWADGSISQYGEQWFKFTATANTQYIHASFGTTYNLNLQFYDLNGNVVGSQTNLYNWGYTYGNLTNGQAYYFRVTNSGYGSGSYRIAFNASQTPPPITLPTDDVTQLNANTWTEGNFSQYGTQWFKFTATANQQYIHISFGTIYNLNLQFYDLNGNVVGAQTGLNSWGYTDRNLTNGQEYYFRVTNSGYGSGSYRIAFNTSTIPPQITLPTADITALTANTWTNVNLTSRGDQWFMFTATANTQYIHIDFGTLSSLDIQIYDSIGNAVGPQQNLSGNLSYMSQNVTSGQVYNIRVTNSSYEGAYQIAFNASQTPPPITLPTTGVTQLTLNTWADGDITSSSGEQWFKFTAYTSTGTQYIHVNFGTLADLWVEMYDSNGYAVGNRQNLWNGNSSYMSQIVTNNQLYYIKVWPYSSNGSGTYKIAFNDSINTP